MSRAAEVVYKLSQVRRTMITREVDALVLRRVSSFAWLTAGAPSYVSVAAEVGEAVILVTPGERIIVTNVIEGPRLREELGLGADGWAFVEVPWAQPGGVAAEIERRTAGVRTGADLAASTERELADDIRRLRSTLCEDEVLRLREVAARCAEAMVATVARAVPGHREQTIAGVMARELVGRGVTPLVLQAASDERIFAYRHLLPTDRRLQRYLFLSFCGRRHGLVVSMTRLVHFGPIPDSLNRAMEQTARVDATLLAATRPGARLGDVFDRARAAYADAGAPDEWQRHHQGGLGGYETRELVVTPATDDLVSVDQAFAWNPTLRGTKSEDTVLTRARGACEVLTATPSWPQLSFDVDGESVARPGILEAPR